MTLWYRIDHQDGAISIVSDYVVERAARDGFTNAAEVMATGRFRGRFADYSTREHLTADETREYDVEVMS